MQEASFTGLIRTLAIFFMIYYALKIVAKYVFPLFVKRTFSKMEERMKAQREAQEPPQKVGEITIDKKPKAPKNKITDTGEYIDFEEVE
jgi:bacteriorhodopsin